MNRKHLPVLLTLIAIYGLVSFFIDRNSNSFRLYTKEIKAKIETDLEELSDRVGFYLNTPHNDLSGNFNDLFSEQEYVYVFENGKLANWSRADYIPRYFQIQGDYQLTYFESESGKFVSKRFKRLEGNMLTEVFVLTELYRKYPFFNKYLNSKHNEAYFPSKYSVEISNYSVSDELPIHIEGQPIFSVKSSFERNSLTLDHKVRLMLGGLIVLVLLFMAYEFFHLRFGKRKSMGEFIYLAIVLSVLRFLIYYFPFPAELSHIEVFNPALVNLSQFNLSLGDTFVNSIFVLFLFWFAFQHLFVSREFYWFIKVVTKRNIVFYFVTISFLSIGFLVTVYQFQSTYTIIFNSPIELDVSRSLVFGVNEVLLLLVICLNAVSFFMLTYILSRSEVYLIEKVQPKGWELLCLSLLCTLTTLFLKYEYQALYGLFLIYGLVSVFFQLPKHLARFKYNTVLYFLFCSVTVAFIHTYAIYKKQTKTELLDKRRFADDILIENDLLAEYLISDISQKINKDLFVISRMLSSATNKDDVGKKIKRVYFNNHFDKYDIRINLFDAEGVSWEGHDLTTENYGQFREKYAKNTFATEYDDLYLVKTDDAVSSHRYFLFLDLKRYEKKIGSVVIELRLKNIIPNNVYPELLVDYQFSDFFTKKQFDYAIYKGDSLATRYGSYNNNLHFDPRWLSKEELYDKGINKEGDHHFGVKSKVDDRIITITSPLYNRLDAFSNFSFLLLLFLAVILILVVFNYQKLKILQQVNLSSKIQLFIFIAFSIPLIALSLVISNSLDASFKEDANEKYLNQSNAIANYLIDDFTGYVNGLLTGELLSNKVAEVAKFTQSDLNLYDHAGTLISTSQPSIYDNNLHSDYANPRAMNELRFGNSDYVIYPETLGELHYQTIYHGLKSYDDGKLIGMIGLPFFDSKSQVQRQQVVIFNQVVRVFSAIFLLSLLASYYVGKVLTRPLSLIADRLRFTNFQNKNEPIKYDSSDEIGLLVKEYNVMVDNLERSKGLLAQSEKESAWKEIAKQVAHEIKNPLTPMKLKLQHLGRIVNDQGFDIKQLNEPVESLLGQVEILDDIATSFSAFARMPIPENERFDIGEVLADNIELFSEDSKAVSYDCQVSGPIVIGDAKLMGRIFNNLLLNAFQAIPEDVQPLVEVNLKASATGIVVSVSDNGKGIPHDIREKIFIPNFTTKSSGSGIGLAVAKRGVELMNGKLWFETETDKGTTFYLELPVVA